MRSVDGRRLLGVDAVESSICAKLLEAIGGRLVADRDPQRAVAQVLARFGCGAKERLCTFLITQKRALEVADRCKKIPRNARKSQRRCVQG